MATSLNAARIWRYRRLCLRCVVLIFAATMRAAPAIAADDLQYNLMEAQKSTTFKEMVWETRGCMNEFARSLLLFGNRDSKVILARVVEQCGGGPENPGSLSSYMAHDLQQPEDVVTAYIRALAYDELNSIPGLKRSKPNPEPAISADEANRRGFDAADRKDYTEAMSWYRTAASKGLAKAQHNIGVLYQNGSGVRKDSAQAARWYRKAAAQGFAPAQYNLGVLYESGAGVPADKIRARYWYNLAAAQGDEDAKKALTELDGSRVCNGTSC